MGIVHSWFQSGWNGGAIGLLFVGLVLMNFDGIMQYAGGACLAGGVVGFLLSSDREDYTKV